MWTAKVRDIINEPQFADQATLQVDYSNNDGRKFTKTYKLVVQHFQTIDDVNILIENDLQQLTRFDNVVALAQPLVDKDIQMQASVDVVLADVQKAQDLADQAADVQIKGAIK